jgi:GT2 family glycosyltransferase
VKISVIIVSYNTVGILEDCLVSLFADLKKSHLHRDVEVIVIDNASTDQTPQMVPKKFPDVIFVRNRKNVGFAFANNQAIGLSKGSHVLLLNSDTIVRPESMQKLMNELEQDLSIGVIGPKLLNEDETLQYSFGYFPSLFRITAWMLFLDDIPGFSQVFSSYHIESEAFYSKRRRVDWVTGACMLVSKEAISSAGILDDDIFMYGEEVEWCYRIKKSGYSVEYIPEVEIIHLKGGSAEKASIAGIAEEFSFILYFFKKHKPSWQMHLIKGILQAGALLRIIVFGIIGKHKERIPIYAKALHMVRQ